MNILVCIKPAVTVDGDGRDSDGWPDLRPIDTHGGISRYDACALEAAVSLKEHLPDVTVEAISVGGASAESALRRAMGIGADHGIHIRVADSPYASPFAAAGWMKDRVKAGRYDLVLAGAVSEDLMTGITGPVLAALLGMPSLTSVVALSVSGDGRTVTARREAENGLRINMRLPLPALLTIQSGINQPRYPSLSNLLRANRHPLEELTAFPLDTAAVRQRVVRVSAPTMHRRVRHLEGSTAEKAGQLADALIKRGLAGGAS